MTLLLIAILVALGISALCSLLEATLLSVTPAQLATLGQRRPRTARIWRGFKQNIEKPIAVILVLNTAAHTMGAAVAGAQFEKLYGDKWLVVFSLVLTYLILQFSEILPKTLGVLYNAQLASVIATPLHWLVRALAPVLWFIHIVNRPFERRRGGSAEPDAFDQINALVAAARTAEAIDPSQLRLLQSAARLHELRVRQIMTPRTNVVFLRVGDPLEDVLRKVQQTPFTRLPLCEGTLDRVIGMVHVRDLLNHLKLLPGKLKVTEAEGGQVRQINPGVPGSALHVVGAGTVDLRRIMRRINVVPELASVSRVLQQFRESRTHLALVVDEYGATQGIVTLEDVLEEVVGEIEDEFDTPAHTRILPLGQGAFRIHGTVPLHELADQIGLRVEADDVDTLGGLVQKELGRLPEVGDTLSIGGFEMSVESLEHRRVGQVRAVRSSVGDDAET